MFKKLLKKFKTNKIAKEVTIINKVIETSAGDKKFVLEAGNDKLLLIDIVTGDAHYAPKKDVSFTKIFQLKNKVGDIVESNLQLVK